ncbi:MAG: hypothetical protein KAT15_30360, partial [Bacteroidales bacterium]|nr:hypothetical protein [Bacteroidales bacterium]
ISHFKEELPDPIRKYRFSEKHPAFADADILMFGDSFLDISRQTTLPERLADTLDKSVFFHRFLAPQRSNPFCVFAEYEYTDLDSKILIYQSVERNIPMKFDSTFADNACVGPESGAMVAMVESTMEKVFPEKTEEMYTQLLKRSVFTSSLFALNARAKFDLFGYVSSQTPIYKTGEQPWLFFHRQVSDEPGSFYFRYTDEEIDRYCDHIALLEKEVKQKLNMQMIFLPVPNKYTIYSSVINNDPYNEFLPRLYEGLKKRNVTFVELYDDFMNADQILYYGTDTHWNELGVDIALNNLVETIYSINH